jgi:hypothetical protein
MALLASAWVGGAPATATPGLLQQGTNTCDAAAIRAADRTGVPLPVLLAISRVESGRQVNGQFIAWPWAVNQSGDGSFFDTPDAAINHVAQAMAEGQSNIDIGCFQLNIRWHGDQFASLGSMFEPSENALYAARFLMQLYDEFGTWDAAIGAYHSRQSGAAAAYLSKVAVLLDTVTPEMAVASADPPPRDNRYPLLQPGQRGRYGSLVVTVSDRPSMPLFR